MLELTIPRRMHAVEASRSDANLGDGRADGRPPRNLLPRARWIYSVALHRQVGAAVPASPAIGFAADRWPAGRVGVGVGVGLDRSIDLRATRELGGTEWGLRWPTISIIRGY